MVKLDGVAIRIWFGTSYCSLFQLECCPPQIFKVLHKSHKTFSVARPCFGLMTKFSWTASFSVDQSLLPQFSGTNKQLAGTWTEETWQSRLNGTIWSPYNTTHAWLHRQGQLYFSAKTWKQKNIRRTSIRHQRKISMPVNCQWNISEKINLSRVFQYGTDQSKVFCFFKIISSSIQMLAR